METVKFRDFSQLAVDEPAWGLILSDLQNTAKCASSYWLKLCNEKAYISASNNFFKKRFCDNTVNGSYWKPSQVQKWLNTK